jgi:hypothetical protein
MRAEFAMLGKPVCALLPVVARIVFAAVFLAASAQAQLTLPSVPIGGALDARVTLTTTGGAPIVGVTVTLTVPTQCGTFQGAPSTTAVTNSSGTFSFVFTPGTTPGNCTIRGQSGGVVETATTHIYRPADLVITPANRSYLTQVFPGATTLAFEFRVNAENLPVYGISVTADPPTGSGGRTPTFTPQGGATNDIGSFTFNAAFPGDPGAFDFVVHAGSASTMVRIQQVSPASTNPVGTGRSLTAFDEMAGIHGPTQVAITSGPASCILQQASRIETTGPTTLPTGVMDFPLGWMSLWVSGCPAGSSVSVQVQYPTALPADGVVYALGVAPVGWTRLPVGSVSGNTATFTLTDGAAGDSNTSAGINFNTVGVGKPGQHVDNPKPAVHDMWWTGMAENGWGMSLAQAADGNVFAAIYAYDDAGKPTWWVLSTVVWDYARDAFENTVYGTYGTPWFAFDARYQVTAAAGSAKFTLTSPDAMSFDYVINGITGHKAIQRQLFGPVDARPVPNVNGMWWGGQSQSGWGISIMQQYATLFAVWFTYDETNKATWYVLPGGSWTGTNTYEGRLYKTHGSPWLGHPYDPAQFVITDAGPYKLTFNGTNATFDFTLDGRTGSLALTRQAPF